MFRRSRETIIALRARHQSFRIATEIGRPHLEMPPPPQPAIPVAREKPVLTYCPSASPPQPGYIQYVDPSPPSPLVNVLMSDIVLSLLLILTGIGVVLLCRYA